MTVAKKSICASITDHVQLSGFRDVVEVHGKARGLKGLVFNDADGSVKVMASGSEQAINDFIHDLKMSRPDTIIETQEIIENIPLLEPFSRVVAGDLREISERLDLGVNILSEHTGLFHGINNKLGGIGDILNSMNNKLGTMGDNFDSFGGKLDTLDSMNNKLGTMGDNFDSFGGKLDTLDSMNNKLSTLADKLDTLPDKLDTLPERLAEVLKK